MYLTSEKKTELFKDHGRAKSESDTGSAESQIALFTFRINHLTEHLKKNKKKKISYFLFFLQFFAKKLTSSYFML